MTVTFQPRSRRLRIPFELLSALLVCGSLSGCNYLIFAGYLIGGPPSIEPEFDALTTESMTDKDVTVAVVCYAPKEVKWNFDKIDHEVAIYVSHRLYQHKIEVINPDRVKAWLDENDDWDRPEEIGAAFDVTYVVMIDINHFSLYEKDSANLYRGRAEAFVSVWKMDEDGEGEKIFEKDVISKYPIHQPIATTDETFWNFKGRYLARFSEEIGRLFYEYYNGDDIPDGA